MKISIIDSGIDAEYINNPAIMSAVGFNKTKYLHRHTANDFKVSQIANTMEKSLICEFISEVLDYYKCTHNRVMFFCNDFANIYSLIARIKSICGK